MFATIFTKVTCDHSASIPSIPEFLSFEPFAGRCHSLHRRQFPTSLSQLSWACPIENRDDRTSMDFFLAAFATGLIPLAPTHPKEDIPLTPPPTINELLHRFLYENGPFQWRR